jgi:WD40 repeat protein
MDDERIVINIGHYPENHLSLYNMKECKEESVYYDGEGIDMFAISSKGWLAVEEYLGSDTELNIYDEKRALVFSDSQVDNYFFMNWSKDGNQFVFQVKKSSTDNKFYLHDFTTGKTKLIGEFIYTASFSPKGDQLVITRIRGEIFILDLGTLEETFLTYGYYPDWRP